MTPKFTSIRFRMLILLGLIFCAVLILTFLHALDRRNADREQALGRLQLHAQLITEQQKAGILLTSKFVSWLNESGALASYASDPKCRRILGEYVKQNPHFSDISIARPDGRIICSLNSAPAPVSISDRQYFQKALASPQQVIGAPLVSRLSHKWIIPFAQRFQDASGKTKGVVVVGLDLAWVNNEFAQAGLPADARMGLVDSNGTVLARYPDPEGLVGKSLPENPFFKAVVAHHGTDTAEAAGHDGVTRIFAFSHFAETTGGPVYLWVGFSKASVTAAADRQITQAIAATLLLAVMTFALAWYGGECFLFRPIGAIADAARRLSGGDHMARSGVAYSADEIGQLARTFDQMAAGLVSRNEILRLNRALRLLSDCNEVLIHARDEKQLLNEICRTVVEQGGYRMAWVGYTMHDAEKSVRAAAHYGYDEGYLDTVRISWADTERGRGPTGTAARTGKAQVNQSFEANATMGPWRDAALKRGYKSSSAFPLASDAGVFGVLTIYSAEPEPFHAEEIKLLNELAANISHGIVNKRVREEHQQSLLRLERSMEATIKAMVTTLELRDPYTAGHELRVSQLAVAIARELGLPEDEIHGIQLASSVFDLGKIHIPAEILVKPGQLNELEFSIIKFHPQAGYDILKGIDFPWPVAEYVRQHHERLDGSGYPQGLKGEEILQGSKIVAVADVVEAMCSHRPYRAALGVDKALEELLVNRGKLYDPAAVDACVRLFREKGFAFER